MGYEERREWSDQFNRQLKGILGPILIRDATPDEDRKSATDMVLETQALRIACRVRLHSTSSYNKYGRQFTLRTKTNCEWTELDKVRRGEVDLLLYCWGNGETRRIREWVLIDLRVMVRWIEEREAAGIETHHADSDENGDGTGWSAYWIHLLPADAVIASGIGIQLHEDSLDIA